MEEDLTSILSFAKEVASNAGAIVLAARDKQEFSVRLKSQGEPVTSIDLEAERYIIAQIKSTYPSHQILSEEGFSSVSPKLLREPIWIIDPIDGTRNFARGHAHVGVSIAYAIGGEVKVGVVSAPFLNEIFWAQKEHGSYLNGLKLSVSTVATLLDSVIATGFPYPDKKRQQLSELLGRFGRVLPAVADVRRAGAASLDICWLAAGRLDGFYEDLSPWDFAAGNLIAIEAGARRGHIVPDAQTNIPEDFRGKGLVLATPKIFDALILVLRNEKN